MLSGLVRTGPYRTRTVPVPYRYGDENPVPVFGRAGTGTVRYGPHFFDEIENIARRRHTTSCMDTSAPHFNNTSATVKNGTGRDGFAKDHIRRPSPGPGCHILCVEHGLNSQNMTSGPCCHMDPGVIFCDLDCRSKFS